MNMVNEEDLIRLLEFGEEDRNIEYKESCPPNIEKLAKSIMAMSNIRDGGYIVFGMKQLDSGRFIKEGIKDEHLIEYNKDILLDRINEYADPYVRFSIKTLEYESKKFLFIIVPEFEEIPVICKRDGRSDLTKGSIYTRTRDRRPESARVRNQTDMREIIELAVDKGIEKMRRRRYLSEIPSGKQLFDEQVKDLND